MKPPQMFNSQRMRHPGEELPKNEEVICFQTVNGSLKKKSLLKLSTQVAGHEGFLKQDDDKVLKPVQNPPKGTREKNFYLTVDQDFAQFIPKFYGIVEMGFSNGGTANQEYIVLQNLAAGFFRPNIMDVKIGQRTYGPDATPKKIEVEDSKYLGTKKPFGFSLVSMLVHSICDCDNSPPKVYDRDFGKSLKTEDVDLLPLLFFDVGSGVDVRPVVKVVVEKISSILEFFLHQRKYLIYSSSLLIVYDARAVRNNGDLRDSINVKIIDFAHVFDSNGEKDENFIFGIRNLIELFRKLL